MNTPRRRFASPISRSLLEMLFDFFSWIVGFFVKSKPDASADDLEKVASYGVREARDLRVRGAYGNMPIQRALEAHDWPAFEWMVSRDPALLTDELSYEGPMVDQLFKHEHWDQVLWAHQSGYLNLSDPAVQTAMLNPLRSGLCSVHAAYDAGRLTLVKVMMLSDSRQATIQSPDGRSLLHRAAQAGDDRLMTWMMRQCLGDWSALDASHCTPVHILARQGASAALREVLDHDPALAFLPGPDGLTPLMLAMEEGHVALAAMLIQEVSFDAALADHAGYTALDWAAYTGSDRCVELMLGQDASIANPISGLLALAEGHHDLAQAIGYRCGYAITHNDLAWSHGLIDHPGLATTGDLRAIVVAHLQDPVARPVLSLEEPVRPTDEAWAARKHGG